MAVPMLRKVALMLGACLMALFLTACGEPSTDGAAKLGKQLIEEVYKGNPQPLLDHMDYSSIESQSDAALAKEVLKGKLTEALNMQQKITEASGGVKSIDVVSSTEKNGFYLVVIKVTFGDGGSRDSNLKFRWNETQETYLLVD